MHADTDAIRALASSSAAHADELAAIASTLAALPARAAGTAFGPVGEPFLAALTDAVTEGARVVAALSARATSTGDAARRSAAAYDDADARAGARVGNL